MTQDKRKFLGSFRVRFGTKNIKFEIACASLFGGELGLVRVRVNRVWLNAQNGEYLFLDRHGLANIIANHALNEVAQAKEVPNIPVGSRISYRYFEDGIERIEGTWTSTTPILAHDGYYYVWITAFGKSKFINTNDIINIYNKKTK